MPSPEAGGVYGLNYAAGVGALIENVKIEVFCGESNNCSGLLADGSMQEVEVVVYNAGFAPVTCQ